MGDRGRFKDADEFIEHLNQLRISTKEIFTQHLGKHFEDGGDDIVLQQCLYIEMRVLSQYEDRELALETFRRMDEDRRNGIIDSLHQTAGGIADELGRRGRGILPEPDTFYADDTTEELEDWLGILCRFAGELGIEI